MPQLPPLPVATVKSFDSSGVHVKAGDGPCVWRTPVFLSLCVDSHVGGHVVRQQKTGGANAAQPTYSVGLVRSSLVFSREMLEQVAASCEQEKQVKAVRTTRQIFGDAVAMGDSMHTLLRPEGGVNFPELRTFLPALPGDDTVQDAAETPEPSPSTLVINTKNTVDTGGAVATGNQPPGPGAPPRHPESLMPRGSNRPPTPPHQRPGSPS